MALPVSFLSLTQADNTLKGNGTPETTTVTLPVITISAANLVAQTTLHDALIAALLDITIGNALKRELTAARTILGSLPSSDPNSQRENKYLMRYHGATLLEKFQASIGCADLSKHMAHSEFIDLTADEGLALKTAFEAVVRSPGDSSEGVVLDSVQFVGRNT